MKHEQIQQTLEELKSLNPIMYYITLMDFNKD